MEDVPPGRSGTPTNRTSRPTGPRTLALIVRHRKPSRHATAPAEVARRLRRSGFRNNDLWCERLMPDALPPVNRIAASVDSRDCGLKGRPRVAARGRLRRRSPAGDDPSHLQPHLGPSVSFGNSVDCAKPHEGGEVVADVVRHGDPDGHP